MPHIPDAPARNLFGTPDRDDAFAAIADPDSGPGLAALGRIADKIGRTRRPGARSDIPAGVTYLTQFVVHDLDFPSRESLPGGAALDLGLIYGDGPRHDAFCYQAPFAAGAGRYLLRVGRTRPMANSPDWGARRDLPRTSCTSLDPRPVDARTEVLVPNSLSDSNLLLGQMQVLWALMHNAIAATLAETRGAAAAFAMARRINRGIYRDVIRRDVLGSWLMPRFRARYADAVAQRLDPSQRAGAPREFMAGVGRLGHGLVREIYALNDHTDVAGLRTLLRQTGTGRPHDMPLTEDWLVDFSRFFAIGSSVPQRARALGPHVARPFATGIGAGADGSDGLVLRDLVASSHHGLRSVRSLIDQATRAEPHLFEGCFAQDETIWVRTVADWLADTGLEAAAVDRLAADPPLTLFLMLEAEADTGGRSLGALGSVIMGETLAAALPPAETDSALDFARAAVFRDRTPNCMADMIRFLQRHYRFAEGARLHGFDGDAPTGAPAAHTDPGGSTMLDIQFVTTPPIARIDVADYIEMGRLVAQWAADPATRPQSVDELKDQLDGIAVVPDRIKTVEFVQSTLDHLVLRLPVTEILEESLERMTDPMGDGRYPLPQFYVDHCRPGFGPVMVPLDTLLARLGDCTIAQCR